MCSGGCCCAACTRGDRHHCMIVLLLFLQKQNLEMRSGTGEARTILLLHIISVRPSKQPLMVLTFLKVYMELGFLYFVSARTKINNNKKKHHNHWLRGKLLLVFICALEYPVAAHTGSYFLFLQEQIKDIIIMDHERRSIALETACIPLRH